MLLACPVVTFFTVDVEEVSRMSRRAQLITDMKAEMQTYEPYEKSAASIESEDEMFGMGLGRPAALARATVRFRDRVAMYTEAVQPWILGGWIVGMTAFGLRMGCGLIGIVRWRRKLQPIPAELEPRIDALGERMKMDRPIRICLSDRVKQAMAVGCLRPMVILPASIITQLPVDMLEAIIAHELAHIRRHDLWINLLQRMAEILFFFHPAVWWISKSLRRERELCCDELAARTIGERSGADRRFCRTGNR
jgi:bla regulator protein blaR1